MGANQSILMAFVVILASAPTAFAQVLKTPIGAVIPSAAGERFTSDFGGIVRLKVGPELYVVRGEVEITLNDRLLNAKTGDTIFIPLGTWMTVRNSGGTDATLLGIIPRADMEKCMRLVHGKVDHPHDVVAAVCHMSVPPPGKPK